MAPAPPSKRPGADCTEGGPQRMAMRPARRRYFHWSRRIPHPRKSINRPRNKAALCACKCRRRSDCWIDAWWPGCLGLKLRPNPVRRIRLKPLAARTDFLSEFLQQRFARRQPGKLSHDICLFHSRAKKHPSSGAPYLLQVWIIGHRRGAGRYSL